MDPLGLVPLHAGDDHAIAYWQQVLEHSLDVGADLPAPIDPAQAAVDFGELSRPPGLRGFLIAVGDNAVGAGWLLRPPAVPEAAEVCFGVLPPARRHGVGRRIVARLAEEGAEQGHARLVGHVHQGLGETAAHAFASVCGLTVTAAETRLQLRLDEAVAQRATRAAAPGEGLSVELSVGLPRPDLLPGFLSLRAAFADEPTTGAADAGVDDLEASLRLLDLADRELFTALVTDETGAVVAFSGLEYAITTGQAWPQNTMVASGQRGRGLGRLAKAAVVAGLVERHPDAAAVHDFVQSGNAPMLAVDEALGFVPVAQRLAVELPTATES